MKNFVLLSSVVWVLLWGFYVQNTSLAQAAEQQYILESIDENNQTQTSETPPGKEELPVAPIPDKLEQAGVIEFATQSTPFSFSLAKTSLNLGQVERNKTSVASTQLSVYHNGAYGFDVVLQQDHDLISPTGKTIPKTTCNASRPTCFTSRAGLWDDIAAVGLGFSVSGQDTPLDFKTQEYFRPLPRELQQVTLMSHPSTRDLRKASLTFKLNTSSYQQQESYHNTVTLFAIPKF